MKTAPDSVLANGVDRAAATEAKKPDYSEGAPPVPRDPLDRADPAPSLEIPVVCTCLFARSTNRRQRVKKAVLHETLQLRPQLIPGISPGPWIEARGCPLECFVNSAAAPIEVVRWASGGSAVPRGRPGGQHRGRLRFGHGRPWGNGQPQPGKIAATSRVDKRGLRGFRSILRATEIGPEKRWTP